MHKDSYASGFIYHPASQKILLQQNTITAPNQWLLFEIMHPETENPEKLFGKLIAKLLDIKVSEIHQVYSYFNENKDRNQSIIYTTVDKLHDFSPKNNFIFNWFTFKDVQKLQVTSQTKHDIVVGQRVIEAAVRKSLGLHTFQ